MDLDYSLEIYDEFVEAYVENGTEDSVRNIAPNEAALEVFDEAEIRASWKMKKHEEAIVSSFLKDDTIISIIKKGVKVSDSSKYGLASSEGQTGCFHGHRWLLYL